VSDEFGREGGPAWGSAAAIHSRKGAALVRPIRSGLKNLP
jgi:hypothetical protein